MLPVWFVALLSDFWRESAPIVIAGGFPSWAMGYTTQYTDIDVFISKQILTLFIRRIKQQTTWATWYVFFRPHHCFLKVLISARS